MMDFEMELFLNYPAIITSEHENGSYYGYIFVQNTGYPISIKTSSASTFSIDITPKLSPFSKQISALLTNNYSHIVQLLNDITNIIKSSPKPLEETLNTNILRQVLRELAELKNFYITLKSARLSNDLSEIRVQHEDESRRLHEVVIGVNYNVGEPLFAIKEFDLPESCCFAPQGSLVGLHGKFLTAVQSYGEFFDFMEDVDAACWVLDPEEPRRKDLYRRIAISDKVSIIVTFNPDKLNMVPNVKVLGSRERRNHLYEKMSENFDNWNVNGNIIEELLKLLDLTEFPKKPDKKQAGELLLVEDEECCICFSLRLDDKLPEIICANECCSRLFHQDCLFKWLLTLNSKRSYIGISGQCPNCDKPIQCPIPEKK